RGVDAPREGREARDPDRARIDRVLSGVERLEREPALGLTPQRVEARAAEVFLEELSPAFEPLGWKGVVDAERRVGHWKCAFNRSFPHEQRGRPIVTRSLSGTGRTARGSAGSGSTARARRPRRRPRSRPGGAPPRTRR